MEPKFVLVVIGWDPANLLRDSGALSSPLIKGGHGCPNCVNGRKLTMLNDVPTFISTDAAEVYVLEFASEADAQTWARTTPQAFVGKQGYAYVPTTVLPLP